MSGSPAPKVMVAYEVPEADASWELEEENVPESAWHDAVIASNLALRGIPKLWKVGVDPDVAVSP